MKASGGSGDREHDVARAVFIVSVIVTIGLYATPQLHALAYPLLLLSTLVHEMGHGLAAVVAGGSFERFELYSDGSGVAHTATAESRWIDAFVAAGGLVGPSVAGAISFLAGRRPRTARVFLGGLAAALLVALFLVVRNTFGWVFVGGFTLLLALLVLKATPRVSQVVLVFLGTQLGLSVYSRSDYLFADSAQTSAGTMPSDVAAISEALLLPHWFWGAVCGALSVLALLIGVRTLWRRG